VRITTWFCPTAQARDEVVARFIIREAHALGFKLGHDGKTLILRKPATVPFTTYESFLLALVAHQHAIEAIVLSGERP